MHLLQLAVTYPKIQVLGLLGEIASWIIEPVFEFPVKVNFSRYVP